MDKRDKDLCPTLTRNADTLNETDYFKLTFTVYGTGALSEVSVIY